MNARTFSFFTDKAGIDIALARLAAWGWQVVGLDWYDDGRVRIPAIRFG